MRHNVLVVEWHDGVNFRDVGVPFVPIHPVHGEGGKGIRIGSRAVPHVAHLIFAVVIAAGALVREQVATCTHLYVAPGGVVYAICVVRVRCPCPPPRR